MPRSRRYSNVDDSRAMRAVALAITVCPAADNGPMLWLANTTRSPMSAAMAMSARALDRTRVVVSKIRTGGGDNGIVSREQRGPAAPPPRLEDHPSRSDGARCQYQGNVSGRSRSASSSTLAVSGAGWSGYPARSTPGPEVTQRREQHRELEDVAEVPLQPCMKDQDFHAVSVS